MSVSKAFQYRQIRYPALTTHEAPLDAGILWARQPKFKGRRAPGSLLVLALDASPSMDSRDTYDGRSRAAHVNDILKATVDGLSQSAIASHLQLCILSFSTDVVLKTANSSGYVFSSIQEWQNMPLGDYLLDVEREGTNIRLALDRATDYIDGFRQSEVAQQLAVNWRHATVVMLTDGEHHTLSSDGKLEESKDIINHVFATLSRSESTCFGFVGLGEGADNDSLISWASEATENQTATARRKRVQLISDRLYVGANNRDSDLDTIVRSFVDVASSRVMA